MYRNFRSHDTLSFSFQEIISLDDKKLSLRAKSFDFLFKIVRNRRGSSGELRKLGYLTSSALLLVAQAGLAWFRHKRRVFFGVRHFVCRTKRVIKKEKPITMRGGKGKRKVEAIG